MISLWDCFPPVTKWGRYTCSLDLPSYRSGPGRGLGKVTRSAVLYEGYNLLQGTAKPITSAQIYLHEKLSEHFNTKWSCWGIMILSVPSDSCLHTKVWQRRDSGESVAWERRGKEGAGEWAVGNNRGMARGQFVRRDN